MLLGSFTWSWCSFTTAGFVQKQDTPESHESHASSNDPIKNGHNLGGHPLDQPVGDPRLAPGGWCGRGQGPQSLLHGRHFFMQLGAQKPGGGHRGGSWNRATPNHLISWDFPLYTIQLLRYPHGNPHMKTWCSCSWDGTPSSHPSDWCIHGKSNGLG